MKWTARLVLALLAIAGGLSQAMAASVADARPAGALVSALYSDDADEFEMLQLRVGATLGPSTLRSYRAVAIQATRYSQQGWHQDGQGIVGVWRDLAPDGTGVNAEVGIVQVGSYTRPQVDATWSIRPAPSTGVEFIGAAGLVETRTAIESGVTYYLLGTSVEHRLEERTTVVGLLAVQPFSDGNLRTHARARLIYDLLPDEGVNLQARWKQYWNSDDDVAGAYFNPRRYSQWLVGPGFRRSYAGWIVSGIAAGGQEQASGSAWQSSWLVDLRAEGTLAPNIFGGFSATYARAAGFAGGPDYWYALVGATLRVAF